jgi:hypothetical protein
VGRTPGIGGTVWRTRLELFNTAAAETTVALFLNLSDRDNTAPAASAQVAVAPRATLIIEDLIAGAFGLDEAVGSVDIVASAPVIAHARIANVGSDVGTFGQAVPGLPAAWAVGDDEVPASTQAATFYLFEARRTGFRPTSASLHRRYAAGRRGGGDARRADRRPPLTLTFALPSLLVEQVLGEMGLASIVRSRQRPALQRRFFAYISGRQRAVTRSSIGERAALMGAGARARGGLVKRHSIAWRELRRHARTSVNESVLVNGIKSSNHRNRANTKEPARTGAFDASNTTTVRREAAPGSVPGTGGRLSSGDSSVSEPSPVTPVHTPPIVTPSISTR